MVAYPVYVLEDLAEISGEPVEAYIRPGFVPMAVRQAIALFKLGTCLTGDQFPEDPEKAEVAEFGILSMADAIYWAQPFQAVLRNPFNSESIGSYSYSKLTAAVSAGIPTGVSWFDIATGQLSICDEIGGGTVQSGGYNVHEENKVPHDGYGVYLGPADQNPDGWGPDTYAGTGM